MKDRLRIHYERHQLFLILFLLFASFRLLAILLFRPGGYITDFSDYDFYYTWGQLVPMGYRVYDNLWTAYPPLFPTIMLTVFEASSRIPPWVEPRLAFHTLFGLVLLLFECANLVLIYRLGNRLGFSGDVECIPQINGIPVSAGLVSAVLYALFFTPVYTLIGWFEPMPLFFMLLGLDLLLVNRTWGWTGSAIAAGFGFLTKLTPILLVPVAIRWLGAKLSWRALREEWFHSRSPGNLGRPIIYTALFFAVVIVVGYPLVAANPSLAFSSFRIQSIRPPWQSIWAIADGFYGFGLVPLDMRNLVGLSGPLWESRLPWTVIGLAFLALYLWLYTRAYDWRQPRTPIAFSAVSVILLFLYSKGWSPQFLLWVLVYIALLMPNLRGVSIAILLSLVNFVEADLFLILLPDEKWIMLGTVLTRTILLILLLVEFVGQIWPSRPRAFMLQKWAANASWVVIGISLIAAVVSGPRAAQAYQERRLAEHPCSELIGYLQEESLWPADTIITQQTEVWRDLYPWLHSEYEFYVLDGYSPVDQPAQEVVLEQLEARVAAMDADEFLWITRSDAPASGSSPLTARNTYFDRPDVFILDEAQLGVCTLYRVGLLAEPLASAEVRGGPIELLNVQIGDAVAGGNLPVVIHWLAKSPVQDNYTVFTQLLSADGTLVAQQDNIPVEGLAPTESWQSGVMIRDPYVLELDPDSGAGVHTLLVGLYADNGERALWTWRNGTMQDHVAFDVVVAPE